MRVSKLLPVLACVGFSIGLATTARAEFLLVSQHLSINELDQSATFSLTFNQAPDFSPTNTLGIPNESFQIEFAGDYTPTGAAFPKDLTAVVRGDEIHKVDALRIRAPHGLGGTGSGGWGPVVDTVPFKLVGDTVSFSAPNRDLGWSGGPYQYNAFSLQYGKLTAQEVVTMVPTPTALQGGLVGLLVVVGTISVIRRRARLRALRAY